MRFTSHRHIFLFAVLASTLALPACSGGDAGGSGGKGGSTTTGTGGSGGEPTGSGGSGGKGGGGGSGGGEADIDMTEADFGCIKDWQQVRLFRITNKLDNLDGSLAVANDPGSAEYPVGTLIQLIPNEAMVKRKKGWNPASNDWEFFSLDTSAAGTKIVQRGTDMVAGPGGNCFNCHALAEPKYDFICEETHGCAALPITDDQILAVQNGDPRCK